MEFLKHINNKRIKRSEITLMKWKHLKKQKLRFDADYLEI